MTKKNKAVRLLNRFMLGQASKEEAEQVDRWYDAYERENPVLDETRKNILKQEMYRTILEKIQKEPASVKVRRLPMRYLVPAAAMLLLGILATLLLIRPSVSSRSLQSAGLISTQGQPRTILLEDGTKISLQPFTQIKTGARKVILLSGEAFFKVFHDPSHPFTVSLKDGLYARVLGTSFNIRSPRSGNAVSIRVQTGRVAVGNARQLLSVLTRGDQIDYDPQTASAAVSHSHIENHLLHFDHTRLQVLAKRLETEYDVRIDVPRSVAGLQCTGTFESTQDVREILKDICLLHHLKLDKPTDPEIFKIRK